MELAFIVLHYITTEDTIACVESIFEKVDTQEYKVLIIDNASPNDSYSQLCSVYLTNDKVHLIHNASNLGYANGNNVGYRYAKEVLRAKFIVIMSNDTLLLQYHINERIKEIYSSEKFAVLGPMILTKDGKCTTNPFSLRLSTDEEITLTLKRCQRELFYNKFGLEYLVYFVSRIVRAAKIITKKIVKINVSKSEQQKGFECKLRNVKLHGSFLILSPEYINIFDGLDSRTFMFFEEEFMLFHVLKNGLATLYSPEIVVYHKEDSATDAVYKKARQKRRFIYENNINSIRAYIKVKNEYDLK